MVHGDMDMGHTLSCHWGLLQIDYTSLIARFMGPSWGPPGDDMTQVGPMLAPWTLLSGYIFQDDIIGTRAVKQQTSFHNANALSGMLRTSRGYNRLLMVRYVVEHEPQYILIHTPYTGIVVFWHISTIHPGFRRVKCVITPPCFVKQQYL